MANIGDLIAAATGFLQGRQAGQRYVDEMRQRAIENALREREMRTREAEETSAAAYRKWLMEEPARRAAEEEKRQQGIAAFLTGRAGAFKPSEVNVPSGAAQAMPLNVVQPPVLPIPQRPAQAPQGVAGLGPYRGQPGQVELLPRYAAEPVRAAAKRAAQVQPPAVLQQPAPALANVPTRPEGLVPTGKEAVSREPGAVQRPWSEWEPTERAAYVAEHMRPGAEFALGPGGLTGTYHELSPAEIAGIHHVDAQTRYTLNLADHQGLQNTLLQRTMDAMVATADAQARQAIGNAGLIEMALNVQTMFAIPDAQMDLDTKAANLAQTRANLERFNALGPTVVAQARAGLAYTWQIIKESQEKIKLAYLERGDKVAADRADEEIRRAELGLRRALGFEELAVRREGIKAQEAQGKAEVAVRREEIKAQGKERAQRPSEQEKPALRQEAFDTYRAYLANPTEEDFAPTQETLDYALRRGAITAAEHRQWTAKVNAARKPSR